MSPEPAVSDPGRPDRFTALPDLPDVLLHAPNTECDRLATPSAQPVPALVVRYLHRNVHGRPWYGHLALVALVMAAQRYEHSSIYSAVSVLHSQLRLIFGSHPPSGRIRDMTTFFGNLDEYMRLYLAGTMSQTSHGSRITFFHQYQAAASRVLQWLRALPVRQRTPYQPWLLAPANRSLHAHRLDLDPIVQARQRRRKEDTDVLMQVYPDIRSEVHLRWNWFTRFRQAYRDAIGEFAQRAGQDGPMEYSYVDGQWRMRLRLWTAGSLLARYPALQLPANADVPPAGARLLELLAIQEVASGRELDSSATLWFADLLRHAPERNRSPEASGWRRAWGYCGTSFVCHQHGILFPSWQIFANRAQACLGHLLVPVDEVFFALTFGLMAVDLLTTTGARLNELMQMSLSEDCLVRLVQPAPAGSADQTPRVRYLFRLIPKGERRAIRHDFFIGAETIRLVARIAQILADEYDVPAGQALSVVPFDPGHRRAHRFGTEPYLLQLNGRHLSAVTISACVRFIVHGLMLRTTSGRPVTVRPHLLRHVFATHAVQVERIPVDIVGAWLRQKNVPVTQYYSQPTSTMIADAADRYLAVIARNIDVADAVLRSPAELQQLYRDAATRTGTLAEVVGGHCGAHGLCKVQFACIGCAAKIPDPSRRSQVEHRREWAEQEIGYYHREGLLPDAHRLEQLVTAADTELREMGLIEQYRADEIRRPEQENLHVNKSATMAEPCSPATAGPHARSRITGHRQARK